MTVGELIKELSQYPKDVPVKTTVRYSTGSFEEYFHVEIDTVFLQECSECPEPKEVYISA